MVVNFMPSVCLSSYHVYINKDISLGLSLLLYKCEGYTYHNRYNGSMASIWRRITVYSEFSFAMETVGDILHSR